MTSVEILCVIGGLGLMAYGVWGVVRAWRLRRDGVSVQGRVARIADDSAGDRRASVEFWAQGRTRRITSRHGPFSSVTVGTSVPVRYAESKPDRAVIDTMPGAFRAPVGWTLSGFFLATIWFVPYLSLLP